MRILLEGDERLPLVSLMQVDGAVDPKPANEITAAVVAYVTAEAIDRVNKSGVLSGSC